MSLSDQTIRVVTEFLYGQNENTRNTDKYLLVHHPEPVDHTTITTVVINESNEANHLYGRKAIENNNAVFPDSINSEMNVKNDTKEIMYEARVTDASMEKPASISEQHNLGKRHKRIGRKHQCNVCKKLFGTPSQVKRHEVVHTKEKPFTCNTCNQGFTQSQDLKRHQSIHTGKWRFWCTVCNSHFRSNQLLKRHILKCQHGEYESVPTHYYIVKCKVCGKEFNRVSLAAHMRTHLSEEERNRLKVHKCSECGRGFDSRFYLMTHQRRCNGIKILMCQFCHMPFSNKRLLRNHIKTLHIEHSERLPSDKTNSKPFSCKTCKCCYYTKKSLIEHKCSCTGAEASHVDCKFCGRSFSDDRWLQKHIEKHHKNHTEKTKRENINDIFRLPPGELELDALPSKKTSLKAFHTCGICFKQFARVTFVRVHMRKHSSTDVCWCEKCYTWFTLTSELNDHTCALSSAISNADFN